MMHHVAPSVKNGKGNQVHFLLGIRSDFKYIIDLVIVGRENIWNIYDRALQVYGADTIASTCGCQRINISARMGVAMRFVVSNF